MHKLISIIFLFSVCGIFSQSIENVDFRAEGMTIVVTYDFLHSKADTAINVKLVFKDQKGGVVTPKTISGNLKNVKPGESKRIVWNVLSDGISLSGKYKAEVSIQKKVPSINIGSQVWTNENLNVDHFRNGDIIPEAKTAEEWINAAKNKQSAWCYYDNDPSNSQKYGKLYNWYAVNDTRGLAPYGWHVPSNQDWIVLVKFICGNKAVSLNINQHFNEAWSYDVADKLNMALKSKIGWLVNGTNTYGYNALPGVMRTGNYSVENWSEGTIIGPAGWLPKEESICWWTGNEVLSEIKYAFSFTILENGSFRLGGPLSTELKDAGLPIRCVKD